METLRIKSSFIKSAAYNVKSQSLRLTIGDCNYYYRGVTRNKITRFLNADSKGRYYVYHIKGQYPMSRRKCAQ